MLRISLFSGIDDEKGMVKSICHLDLASTIADSYGRGSCGLSIFVIELSGSNDTV